MPANTMKMQSCFNSTLICLGYGHILKLSNSNPTSSSTSVTVPSSTGDKAKSERLSSLYQQQHSHQTVSSLSTATSTPSHKMSGGIRRTVSSATPSSTGMGTNAVARPVTGVVKSLSSNTQASAVRAPSSAQHITGAKDPHKKLDRSFSEPAEKKNAAASAASAAASLGPSSRYKTELCRSFAEVGSCKYGDKCQFAHGEEELRTVNRHPKFKTENCKSFHSTGFCPYGPRCHFIHNSDESKKSMSNHNVPSTPTIGHQRMSFDSQVPTAPTVVASQHMPAAVCQPAPAIAQPTAFPATSPAVVMSNANLVRPKALSLGSYSLGSSGEISPPSSQSGSPTSLNSFFAEDGYVGLGGPFSANSVCSRMAPMNSFPANGNNTFSFSPDSAFSSFTSGTSSNGSTSGSSLSFGANNGSQKCIFGGSQPALSSRYSPEPTSADETASSVIYSLFGGSPNSTVFNENSQLNDFIQRAMSPIGKPQLLMYPSSPESPVDSVASEIEALKLGEAVTSFSPISSSFSTSSLSTSSASPPNGIVDLDAFTLSNCANIPRLPTFAKFATTSTSISGVNCHD